MPPIRDGLSELANRDELRYREEVQARTDSPESFVRKIRQSGRLQLLPHLRACGLVEPAGQVLEIGAGSGWLSAQLSLVPAVERAVATDFSPRLVREVMPVVADDLGADRAKLTHETADFHALPFPPGSFDFVFADSALHHATDVTRVLREARRVLRPSGRLIALREPVRPVFAWFELRARRGVVCELANEGVPEPLYTRAEWEGFFEDAGFRLTWHGISFSHGLRRFASSMTNGVFRADYCMIGNPLE